jgi:hypothetical protein
MVFHYRLNKLGSIPGRGKVLSSNLCVQTSSEVHPASYPMGTGVPFRWIKLGRSVTLTTQPYSRSQECVVPILFLPLNASIESSGTDYFCMILSATI